MKKYVIRMLIAGVIGYGARADAVVTDYKLSTWNIQGAYSGAGSNSKWVTGIKCMFLLEGIQIVAIQEAGARPPSAQPTAVPGTAGGVPLQRLSGGQHSSTNPQRRGVISDIEESVWRPGGERGGQIYIYHLNNDIRVHRLNIAIASRIRADEIIIVPPMEAGANVRPTLGIRINNDYFFNLHAGAHPHNEASQIVRFIDSFMTNDVLPQRPEASWVIMGDFNQSPDSLRASLSSPSAGLTNHYNVVGPVMRTHESGHALDYAVFGGPHGIARLSAAPPVSAMMTHISDHVAVRFTVHK